MEQIITAAVCLHIHATRLIVQQKLRAGAAVTACLVMLQVDSQVFTQGIQLVIGEIGKAAPSHLAGTRIGNGAVSYTHLTLPTTSRV